MSQQIDQTSLSERLHGVEVKLTFILSVAMVLLPVIGGGFLKLLDMSEKQGSLTSKVDGYDKEAFMQIVSSIKTDNGNGTAAGELKEAVTKIVNETVEKRRRGEPVQPGLYYELGKFSVNNGHLEQAIDYFQQAVKGNPLDYVSLSSMGACYLWLAQGQKEQESYYAAKAIDVLKKALAIKSDHLNAHLNLGIAYYLIGQRESAINEWNSAIKINYQDDGPYFNFACMYSREGNSEQALRFLEKAIVNYGYKDLAGLDGEEDLKIMRSNPRFIRLREIVVDRARNAVTP